MLVIPELEDLQEEDLSAQIAAPPRCKKCGSLHGGVCQVLVCLVTVFLALSFTTNLILVSAAVCVLLAALRT